MYVSGGHGDKAVRITDQSSEDSETFVFVLLVTSLLHESVAVKYFSLLEGQESMTGLL